MRRLECGSGVLAGAAAATVLVLTVGAAPAAGAPPDKLPGKFLEFEHFEDVDSFLSEDGEDFGCDLPFDVQYDLQASGVARFGPRGRDGIPYFHLNVHGFETFSANGHVVRHVFNVVDGDHEIVDEGDTLLITGQAAGGDRVYVDGRLTFRDPGMVRYQARVDHAWTPSDPSDDEFLEELGVIKGSTGLNETEGRDFCEDLATFLAP